MENKKPVHLPWREIERIYKKHVRSWFVREKKPTKKYNKLLRMRNKKLCKKYPWLIPRNVWTGRISWIEYPYDNTELDNMRIGWRKAFGDIWCEEIQKILKKNNFVHDFRIVQLKEKYGQLRCYTNGHPKELDDLIWCFETISEYVCVRCGKLDTPIINNYGWYIPVCKKCYEKQDFYGNFFNFKSYQERLDEAKVEKKEDMIIPISVTLSTWSKDNGDQKRSIDMVTLVEKIRYKNRHRRTNADEVYGNK